MRSWKSVCREGNGGNATLNIYKTRDLHDKIEMRKERIERLRAAMEMGSRQMHTVPARTAAHDKLADAMAKLDELEREQINDILSLEMTLQDIEAVFDALPAQQQRVMRLRYVEGLSWRQVSRKAHYSEKHCLKIHRAALKRILNDTFHGGTMIS